MINTILIKALRIEGWTLETSTHLTHPSGADINYDGKTITATRADGEVKDCGDSLPEAIKFVKALDERGN
jgi:hypothetical protein